MSSKAIIRTEVEKLPGVLRTWFEWESGGDFFGKTLVVEIDAGTDPEESNFGESIMEQVSQEVAHVLDEKTTMRVHRIRIVPAGCY